MAGNVSYL